MSEVEPPLVDAREGHIIMGTVWLAGGVNNRIADISNPSGRTSTIMPFYYNRMVGDWISLEAIPMYFGRDEVELNNPVDTIMNSYSVHTKRLSAHNLLAPPAPGYLLWLFGSSNVPNSGGPPVQPVGTEYQIRNFNQSDGGVDTAKQSLWPEYAWSNVVGPTGSFAATFDPAFKIDKFDRLQIRPQGVLSSTGPMDPYISIAFHFSLQDRDRVDPDE